MSLILHVEFFISKEDKVVSHTPVDQLISLLQELDARPRAPMLDRTIHGC